MFYKLLEFERIGKRNQGSAVSIIASATVGYSTVVRL
jgi:hypothetical protein